MSFDITGDLTDRDETLIQELQMVFQNPDSTMNPSHSMGQQIGHPMVRFGTVPRNEVRVGGFTAVFPPPQAII